MRYCPEEYLICRFIVKSVSAFSWELGYFLTLKFQAMKSLLFRPLVASILRKVLYAALGGLGESHHSFSSPSPKARNHPVGSGSKQCGGHGSHKAPCGQQVFWQDVEDVEPLNAKCKKIGKVFIPVIAALLLCTLLTSCIKVYEFPKERVGDCYVRTYHWAYKNRPFRATFRIPVSVYDHYDALPKNLAYDYYACEDSMYPYMDYVVRVLQDSSADFNFDQRQWAEYVLAFVQAMPYSQDPYADEEYVRFPVISIVEGALDCEDKSLVFSAICSFSGIPSALVGIPSEHHMAAAIKLDGVEGSCGQRKGGSEWNFCEATSDGWNINENSCPDAHQDIYPIPTSRPPIARQRRDARIEELSQEPIIVHPKIEVYEDH